ncbi:hypothetical protein JTE90_002826 [Oedothorax gibbosus]|uniref:Uncharacterized protein n=1 Tax=Oedothorax gibbosus TaxID=931172 RepID=A0AAV6U5H1_9ARAC|nr:hypothetical protein JTE90_002826 [Oedothorax gibbosus]
MKSIYFCHFFKIVICGLCQTVDTRAVYSNSNLKPSGKFQNLVDEFIQNELAQYPDYEYSNKNEDRSVQKTQDKTSKDFLYDKSNCNDGENCSEKVNLRQSIAVTNDDQLGSSTENSLKHISDIVNNKDVFKTVEKNPEDKFVDEIGDKNDENEITNKESKEKKEYYSNHVNRIRMSEKNKDEIAKNTENNNNEEKKYYNIGIKEMSNNDEYENYSNLISSNVGQDKEKLQAKNNFEYSDKSSQDFDSRNNSTYGGSLENQNKNLVNYEKNDYDEERISYIPDNIERIYPVNENAVIQNEIVGHILDKETDKYQDISDEVEKTKLKYGFRIPIKISAFDDNMNDLKYNEIVRRKGNTKKSGGDKDTMALKDREVDINNNTNRTYNFIKRVSSYSDTQYENSYPDLNNMLKNKNTYADYDALKGEVDAIDTDDSNKSAFNKESVKIEKAEKLLKKLRKENKSRSKSHKPQTNKKVKVYKKHLKIWTQNRMKKTSGSSSCSKQSGEGASESPKYSKHNRGESKASSGNDESSEKGSEAPEDGEQESGESSGIEEASESPENSEEENKLSSGNEETSESPEYTEDESEASSGSEECSEEASEYEEDSEESSESSEDSEESSEAAGDSDESSESSEDSDESSESSGIVTKGSESSRIVTKVVNHLG